MNQKEAEIRLRFIVITVAIAVILSAGLAGAIRWTEYRAQPSQEELILRNEILFDRLEDYATLQRALKTEYIRCRNVVGTTTGRSTEATYCYDFISWASQLGVPLFDL